MAWFVAPSAHPRDYPKWWSLRESEAAVRAACAEVQAEVSTLEREDPRWNRTLTVQTLSGYRLPKIERPLAISISASVKSPPQIMWAGYMGYLVTADVMEMIEECGEQDCQFIPVQVHKGRTQDRLENRWILNITKRLSTIIAEKSPGVKQSFPDRERRPRLDMLKVDNWQDGVAASRQSIGSSAIWAEYRLGAGQIGLSDRLAQEIKKRKIRGWRLSGLGQLYHAFEI